MIVYMDYNINIRLFSLYGIENTYIKQIIHVWLAWLTKLAAHKSCRANSIIFKF